MTRKLEAGRAHLLGWGLLLLCTVPAEAATYYVATTGSDANPGTDTAPFRTIEKGVIAMNSGDTLLVKNGTYTAKFPPSPPAGTSWENPTILKAYPGHQPVIVPFIGDGKRHHVMNIVSTHHLIIDGFILDGSNHNSFDGIKITWDTVGYQAHRIRIQNTEIKNMVDPAFVPIGNGNFQGIFVGGEDDQGRKGDYNEFINVNIHDNGLDDFDHGMYITSSYNLIENCDIYRNAGWGISFWNSSHPEGGYVNNNVVRNCRLHDNARVGTRGFGLSVARGNNNLAYNNLIYGNNGGIQVFSGLPTNTKLYNNTVYGNDLVGITVQSGANGTIVRNNIAYGNNGPDILNSGTNTILSHNLTTNPLFVNAAANDFHLQSTSPAIDTGTPLSEVTTDYEGNVRPLDGPDADTLAEYDIGAYEYRATAALVGDLNGDGLRTLIDVRWLIEMLLGTRPKNLATADLDGNGSLTFADCQALIRLLVGVL